MKYAAIEQTDKEVLDSHLFVEALAMVAIDISPSTYTFPEAVECQLTSSSLAFRDSTPLLAELSSRASSD
jgi:hypothetical protein